jgi:Tol biopolymer transport system component
MERHVFDAMATLHRTIVGRIPRFALFSALAGVVVVDPATAQSTTLISVDSAGIQGAGLSGLHIALSANGRYVAFESLANNLVSGDTNPLNDVFLHDRLTGTTECVSVDSAGNFSGTAINEYPTISGDGSVVAFVSAWPFVAGDTNNVEDVYLRDRVAGTTERISVDSAGAQGNALSGVPDISADGRFVAFVSLASNLVAGDTNGKADVFVHDRQTKTTERVSVDSAGLEGNGDSGILPTLSADGRFVAFTSLASNLVAGDTNGSWDIFVRDRQTQTTQRVSVDSAGLESNGNSEGTSISADGQTVEFVSDATNLVALDTNGANDVFVHDLVSGVTERASVDTAGVESNGETSWAKLSADGRFVAFSSVASNLVANDTNGVSDVFLRDRRTQTTTRASLTDGGAQAKGMSLYASISPDGRIVAFQSRARNLVPGDANFADDVFTRGPDLTLEATPSAPTAGATLTFDAWTGAALQANLLVLTDVNGTATFVPALLGSFDAVGGWSTSATVPNGLSGNVLTFTIYGLVAPTGVRASNPIAVAFQ